VSYVPSAREASSPHRKRLEKARREVEKAQCKLDEARQARNDAIAAAVNETNLNHRLSERAAAQCAGVSSTFAGRLARGATRLAA